MGREEHRVETLVPRQDLTGAARSRAERYEVNDVLRYSRASKETGIGKGEYARVVGIDAPHNRITVELKDGTERTYDPHRQQGVSVYREELRSFSQGDRIQFTAPVNDLNVANRELGTVQSITESRMSLRMDDGRSVSLDPDVLQSAQNFTLDFQHMRFVMGALLPGLRIRRPGRGDGRGALLAS